MTSVPLTPRSRLLSAQEVAVRLGTSPRHVRRLVEQKRIPYLKIGHFVRFDPDEIERWVENQRVTCSAARELKPQR